MQQLIYFLKRYKHFLYLLFLQFLSIGLTINNHNFHRSKFINSTSHITGGLINKYASIKDYFHLREKNKSLISENTDLRNQLALLLSKDSLKEYKNIDSTKYFVRYSYLYAKIRKNEFHKLNNFITINIGSKKGITKEMGVINNKGIIGITEETSQNYSRVQSILNKNSKINARFKNNFYFGTLIWNGKNTNIAQLTDIPRQAIFKKGDTIITGGKSTIFPEGIPIGKVIDKPKKLTATNTVNIELFNDMSNLNYVYVIKSHDKEEVESLEKQADE